MAERYFPGFEFREFETIPPSEAIDIDININKSPFLLDPSIKVIKLDEVIPPGGVSDYKQRELPFLGYRDAGRRILEDYWRFVTVLSKMDKAVRYPRLTLFKVLIKFVSPNALRAKTEEEKDWLNQYYGDEYAASCAIGECKRKVGGVFVIKIGSVGKGYSEDDVMGIAAHEYGHTLGLELEDPIFEELKADAFENLFMSYYDGVNNYRPNHVTQVLNVHDAARFRLEQLMERGLSEEAILAHLTDRKFGQARSDDYLKFC